MADANRRMSHPDRFTPRAPRLPSSSRAPRTSPRSPLASVRRDRFERRTDVEPRADCGRLRRDLILELFDLCANGFDVFRGTFDVRCFLHRAADAPHRGRRPPQRAGRDGFASEHRAENGRPERHRRLSPLLRDLFLFAPDSSLGAPKPFGERRLFRRVLASDALDRGIASGAAFLLQANAKVALRLISARSDLQRRMLKDLEALALRNVPAEGLEPVRVVLRLRRGSRKEAK